MIIYARTGACLLLECEQKQDARRPKLLNKQFKQETKQE